MLVEVTTSSQQKIEHLLQEKSALIGKSEECNIQLHGNSISREHCRLSTANSGVLVADLGSTNGTYFKGQRQERFELQYPKDRFQIGDYTLRLRQAECCQQPFAEQRGLQLLHRLHQQFIQQSDAATLSDDNKIKTALTSMITAIQESIPLWCNTEMLATRLIEEISGLGPIDKYFTDPTISEIMVNGPNQIYIERAGKLHKTADRFLNNASLLHCIQKIITPVGRSVDEHQPMVDARIPGRARVNAIIPPLSLNGPALTIRKFTSHNLTIEHLVEQGALSETAAACLQRVVKKRRNMVVVGGTDSGKTTLLNLLSTYIDPAERIITIEDTAELDLRQPHVLSLEARPANLEERGRISIRDLVRNALRMRPDRLLIGECRSGEALDMLQAMNTGHDGCMTTLHANSTREALTRLETMCLLADVDLPIRAIRQQISAAIDLIVYLQRQQDGQRIITTITEVCGLEEETITTQDLFVRGKQKRLQPTGIVPDFLAGEMDAISCFNS